jgi:N5-(carboxyethyl)ornithine synthase
MAAISFIKPNYPNEQRVSILPNDLKKYKEGRYYDRIGIETGFGDHLGISDEEYIATGCEILTREQAFSFPTIYSLKLIQTEDYKLLKRNQEIIGWMHPAGSGKEFCSRIALNLNISIFDIDSVYPRIYWPNSTVSDVRTLPRHFFWKNSYIAGIAATRLGLSAANQNFDKNTNVAILGSGSVSQGAFNEISARGMRPRLFYRKTLDIFNNSIDQYNLIINGIEIDSDQNHIIDKKAILRTQLDTLIIDAAADAGRAIEGTKYLSIDNPIGDLFGRRYVLVNNAPTLLKKESSEYISEVTAKYLLCQNFFKNADNMQPQSS